MTITYDQLRQIMPHAPSDLVRFVEPLNAAMEEFEINTPIRQAAFLAQLAHESGSFRYMEEIADGSAYESRGDLGNTMLVAIEAANAHDTTPGRFYKGHGPIQITGFFNHKQCGAAIGLDLINQPALLTLPSHGCRAAGWFWQSRGCNELADGGKFEAVTRKINGGLNGLADRMAHWDRASRVLMTKE